MSQSRNRYLIIIILGALSTISPFAIDMYLPAFSQIAAALHSSTARISLSIASYFAGMAAGQLFYGPLLDRFGRKLPLYAGLILFVAASILCLCSRTVEWLIAFRFVQALGGCAAQVSAMAMVRDFFPARDAAKIISLLILILGVSPFHWQVHRGGVGLEMCVRRTGLAGRDCSGRSIFSPAGETSARPHHFAE